MSINQPFGAALFVGGIVLLAFGYHYSQAPVDQLTNTLTGRYTDDTMWYVFGGIAAVIAGGALALSGKRA